VEVRQYKSKIDLGEKSKTETKANNMTKCRSTLLAAPEAMRAIT